MHTGRGKRRAHILAKGSLVKCTEKVKIWWKKASRFSVTIAERLVVVSVCVHTCFLERVGDEEEEEEVGGAGEGEGDG